MFMESNKIKCISGFGPLFVFFLTPHVSGAFWLFAHLFQHELEHFPLRETVLQEAKSTATTA